jgi:stage III sporulation protein AG
MKLPWDGEQFKAVLQRHGALLLVLAVGLGLLFLPAQKEEHPAGEQNVQEDAEAYVNRLERRLAAALSQMDGVGQATVVLTLEDGGRRELAVDEKGDERETVVVSGGTGRQETVVVQESAPRLQGALVICPGGGDAQVRLDILHSVMALTGLRANQISICQGGRFR